MPVTKIPPLLALIAGFAIVLGLPIGLYVLLTRGRRRAMKEIRQGAEERGWRYKLRHWQGNPTAFRIEGATRSGLNWIMKSGGTRGYNKGWTTVLGLRVPILGGEVDVSILPREPGHGSSAASMSITPAAEARVAAFSGAIASGVEFFQQAQELPSGLAAFDAAYRVLVLTKQFSQPPVDATLAGHILHWPENTIAPHSMLAWRDAFGFCVDARLPEAPNWNTVCYLASLAEELCARVPAPILPASPPTLFDRILGRFLRP